jgi:hypothetical protein
MMHEVYLIAAKVVGLVSSGMILIGQIRVLVGKAERVDCFVAKEM